MRTKELFAFIKERNQIHDAKERHAYPKPWTLDPILQQYRFCNVYREEDTQTKWFGWNWRYPNKKDPDLWFASLVFRFINWSETATELGYPVPWDPARFKTILQARKRAGKKVYSGAYMISTHGKVEAKDTYLAKSLTKIWANREKIRYRHGETLEEFHTRLMKCFDIGSFIAAQVIADCKYVHWMYHAKDWWTFAASGPGSRRGMNFVLERPMNAPWKEAEWREQLTILKSHIDPLVAAAGMPRMHAQDLQNCLCEYSKYSKVKLGLGFPKQRYAGAAEDAKEIKTRR